MEELHAAAVVGGGVVGCAVAHALARRGVAALLLEAEPGLALGASGTNSGILHTGFDSTPGELETRLILRSAQLREELASELRYPLLACGARLRPEGEEQREAVRELAERARGNGVRARLRDDGSLAVAGEAVTDPVAYTGALAGAAQAGGARVRLRTRVQAVHDGAGGLELELAGGAALRARAVVNCAGLFADELARACGDELPEIYPRKGEFLVFAQPASEPLREILLPLPSAMGKGVLVFPTTDGHLAAGPTARERTDKRDWTVEPDAAALILAAAERAHPALAGARPLASYAGLRTAGRGANYVIERSHSRAGLVHVAAIRSTGLSASLAIGELVAALLAEDGAVELGPPRPLCAPAQRVDALPWWRRAALHRAAETA